MRNTYKWLYNETADTLENKLSLPSEYAELVSQLSKRYNINILNIVFKVLKNAHYAKKSCQLYVVYDGDITASQKANINRYIALLFVETNKHFKITDDPNVLYLTVNMLHFDEIRPLEEENEAEKPESIINEGKKPSPADIIPSDESNPELSAQVLEKPAVKSEAHEKPAGEVGKGKLSAQARKKAWEELISAEDSDVREAVNTVLQKKPPKKSAQKTAIKDEIKKPPEKTYDRYREISLRLLNKKEKLPPIFRELRDWLDSSFGLYAVTFMLADINSSSPAAHPVLEISLINKDDVFEAMTPSQLKDIKLEITKQFFILNRKHKICPDSYIKGFDVLFFNLSRHLKDSIVKIAAENFEKFIKAVYSTIPVYKIISFSGRTFIFFNKTKDLNKSEKTGMKSMLEEEYLNFLKKTDEYGFFEPADVMLVFSSHEILDKDFKGNENNFCESYSPA